MPVSIARHHAEWLSLLEVSGPFLSMPVLLRAFPQGLDAADPEITRQLRLAYDEWTDNQGSARLSAAIHTAWVRFVLSQLLDMPSDVVAQGQDIPQGIKAHIELQNETLRPDIAIMDASETARPRLLIQVLPPTQDPDKVLAGKLWKASPASRMAELLRATNVRLGLVTNGERWMLVDAPQNGTAGFISWYSALWLDEPITLRAFRSLLGVKRFFGVPEDETIEQLLAASANDQQELTDQLGYQVRRAIEVLVESIDHADQDRNRALLGNVAPAELYEAALTVMMRLVFLLCAEERGLLLLGDPLYDQNYAVSTLRAQLREIADQHGEDVLERRFDAWYRLLATFHVMHSGARHDLFSIPAYGGGLFDPDRYPFLALPINNRTVLHLLEALQILQVKVPGGGPAEARRVSFRALDVVQIGHIYEGLLDHTALRAAEPILGLTGSKDKEPEIPLSALETQAVKGQPAFIKYLADQTGHSTNAVKKALDAGVLLNRLDVVCGNDEALIHRVTPFSNLIREDDFGSPVVIPTGSVYVTAGSDRRSTGTHHTPLVLSEPLIQYTLEPVVYIGPAEGAPRDEWKLKSPRELLGLKICDLAMGCGTLLVGACRYLAERLVEAWEETEEGSQKSDARARRSSERPEAGSKRQDAGAASKSADHRVRVRITPEGDVSQGKPGETLIPQDDDERLVFARRLVAERCIYGVDKNPLAVEIAKLSMWLTTLDKGRPFTFLDHALKCGDSLVGIGDIDQLRYWEIHPEQKANTPPLFGTTLYEDIDRMVALRNEIECIPDLSPDDLAHKQAKLAQADAIAHDLKQAANLLVGSYFNDLATKPQTAFRNALLLAARDMRDVAASDQKTVTELAHFTSTVRPFHWPLEFPEVFASTHGGFDAFVGNPPFIGGKRIRETLGDLFRAALYLLYSGSAGGADLSAFFFLRTFELLRMGGTLGLIATNTIAQGDTRETGLDKIVKEGGTIFRAINNMPWPGMAAVFVNVVHIAKCVMYAPFMLDESEVEAISPLLDARSSLSNPLVLTANRDKSFVGSFVNGMGFILSPEEAQVMIDKDLRYRDVLFPYLNGEDLNSSPDQSPSRWVINFFNWPLAKAETYAEPMAIVLEKVKPVRDLVNRDAHRRYWWHYGDKRPALYRTITLLKRVLVIALTSRTAAVSFMNTGIVFSHAIGVFAFEANWAFALLQASSHTLWALKYGSSLKGDLRYTPSDCFETYPFPQSPISNLQSLDSIGETYYEHRRQIMLARQEGLTKTYNRFHNPGESSVDIARLRELHVQMDHAVAEAYGWSDIDLGHGFHETAQGLRYTISQPARREVLARLLRLNHERYAEEVKAGLHEKKVGKGAEGKGRSDASPKAGRAKAVKEDSKEYRLF